MSIQAHQIVVQFNTEYSLTDIETPRPLSTASRSGRRPEDYVIAIALEERHSMALGELVIRREDRLVPMRARLTEGRAHYFRVPPTTTGLYKCGGWAVGCGYAWRTVNWCTIEGQARQRARCPLSPGASGLGCFFECGIIAANESYR